MQAMPAAVAAFLAGKRFAVAGVSRQAGQPANAVLHKLRACGYEAIPINPQASELEGGPCYPDLASVPGPIDGVLVVTHPAVSADIVRQALERGLRQL
jgi:predicted CoA-binding protein